MSAYFSSEAGEALTFFASFFVSRQKEEVGFGAKPQKLVPKMLNLNFILFYVCKIEIDKK
ncbi:MAG: hypothetical protein GX879_09355 [Bacteroidales bacterium]|nr:hypothetical protein [Bacteroidales bacterium]